MKVRNGFISNSSSSCFIISKEFNKDEIINFVKAKYVEEMQKHIEETKINKEKWYTNWQDVIRWDEEKIKQIDEIIEINSIENYLKDWDLDEWFDIDKLDREDYILFDNDNNILNWITEIIVEKFDVKNYCPHT